MTVRVERIPGVRIVWEPGLSSQRRRGWTRPKAGIQSGEVNSRYQALPAEMMVNAQADAQ